MFLRSGCQLPAGFRLRQERFNLGWMLAGDISAVGLDATLRRSGWHFRWSPISCSRLGCGRSEASAISHATARALRRIGNKFNVAEVDKVRVSNYGGLRIARVTAHAREISKIG